jgi:hypothetical protein
LDFDEHLSSNPNSEIIGELNRINTVLQGFITDIEAENLRRTERSVLLVREKYEADKVLEIVSGYFSASRNSFRIKSESSSIVIVREKYEADKVLEIDNKVKELKRTHKWLLVS